MQDLKDFLNEYNQKFYNLPMSKKAIVVILICLLFLSMYLLATQKRIDTIKYNTGCTETFINGEIQGELCLMEREEINKSMNNRYNLYNNGQGYNFPINFTLGG